MKKLVFSLMLILFTVKVFGQTTTLSKEDYLQKSKNQKTAGWVLFAGGTTLAIVGIIVGNQDDPEQLGYGSNFETGTGLLIAGIAADLISIPVFISASNNALRAAKISFNNQRIQSPLQTGYALNFQPAITLTFQLR